MIKINDINIRDPFILKHNGKYYLYGSTNEQTWGGKVNGYIAYESTDLKTFSSPVKVFENDGSFWGIGNYWAPEVHFYKGKFYLFGTSAHAYRSRSTQIFVSDSPLGPFAPIGSAHTPFNMKCIDGTLFINNDTPYMIYCHEWVECKDGKICIQTLSEDLTTFMDEPKTLFSASNAPWTTPINDKGDYVTDGPFVVENNGKIYLLWSSFQNDVYAVGVAELDVEDLTIKHHDKPIILGDGGHAMVFNDDGNLKIVYHSPNKPFGEERIVIKNLMFENGDLKVV